MADKHIAIYLNDHLAGSVAALEILEQLETEHTGTPLQQFLAELRADNSGSPRLAPYRTPL